MLEAYFLTFPDRLPKPAGPRGRFLLVARVLGRDTDPNELTCHETPEAAMQHAKAIAAAREAALEP